MADQKIKLVVEGDTGPLVASFNNAISQIEKRINNLKVPAGMFGGNTGMAGGGVFQNSGYRASSGGAQSIQQVAGNVPLSKGIATAALQERSNVLLQNILTELQRQNGQLHLNNLKQSGVGMPGSGFKASSGGGSGGGGGTGPGSGGAIGNKFGTMPAGGITSLSGLASFLGAPGMVLGAGATAMAGFGAYGMARQSLNESANRARLLESSAFMTQGQQGQRLQSILSGGAGEENLFNIQRIQAAQIADQTMRERVGMTNDPYGLKAAERQLRNPKELFQNFASRFGYNPYGEEIAASRTKEERDIQAEQFQAIRDNPKEGLYTQEKERYLKNLQGELQFQRQTGMSDIGLQGFLSNNQGFKEEQLMGASSAIIGAGGSTRAAQNNASVTSALQMARRYDITNAPAALGAISGQLGSAQLSSEALTKVMEEGTRRGYNKSENREESRKFIEMASNFIRESGATTGADVDKLMNLFGHMVTSKTIVGQEVELQNLNLVNQQSGIQTGPGAALRAGALSTHPVLGKLPLAARNALFQLHANELTGENFGSAQYDPNVIKAAKAANMSVTDYLAGELGLQKNAQGQRGIMGRSLFYHKETDVAMEEATRARERFKADQANPSVSKVAREKDEELMNKSLATFQDWLASEDTGAKTAKGRALQAYQMTGGEEPEGKKPEEVKRERDITVAQQAEGDRLYATALPLLQKSMTDAATASQTLTGIINGLAAAMNKIDPNIAKKFAESMNISGILPPQLPHNVGSSQ